RTVVEHQIHLPDRKARRQILGLERDFHHLEGFLIDVYQSAIAGDNALRAFRGIGTYVVRDAVGRPRLWHMVVEHIGELIAQGGPPLPTERGFRAWIEDLFQDRTEFTRRRRRPAQLLMR